MWPCRSPAKTFYTRKCNLSTPKTARVDRLPIRLSYGFAGELRYFLMLFANSSSANWPSSWYKPCKIALSSDRGPLEPIFCFTEAKGSTAVRSTSRPHARISRITHGLVAGPSIEISTSNLHLLISSNAASTCFTSTTSTPLDEPSLSANLGPSFLLQKTPQLDVTRTGEKIDQPSDRLTDESLL